MIDFELLAQRTRARDKERTLNPCPLLCVVNLKRPISTWEISFYHYVGRDMPHNVNYRGSSLGNPFSARNNGGRDNAVELYRRHLWGRMQDPQSDQCKELLSIMESSLSAKGIALACWCAPLRCHADVVKNAVEYMWNSGVRPDNWFPGKGINQSWAK